jgi:hypothetical protein
LNEEEIETRITKFLNDVESHDLKLFLRAGLVGIKVTQRITINLKNLKVTIRSPEHHDFRDYVVTMRPGDRINEVIHIPRSKIPVPTAIMDIEFSSLERDEYHGFFGAFHPIMIVDAVFNAARGDLNNGEAILELFQSRQIHRTHTDIDIFLPHLTNSKPVLSSRNFHEPLEIGDPFVLEPSNLGRLKMFWERMLHVNFWRRVIDHTSPYDEETDERYSGPTSYAFYQYLGLTKHNNRDDVKRIYDLVHALESLHPSRDGKRAVIRRIGALLRLIGFKPDYTALHKAYRIRNEYTHNGPGWRANDDRSLDKLGTLLLFYLRVSVICRILLVNWSDTDFVRMLDKEKLDDDTKVAFAGLKHMLMSEPIIKERREYWLIDGERLAEERGIKTIDRDSRPEKP